jgi:hypothetical protein
VDESLYVWGVTVKGKEYEGLFRHRIFGRNSEEIFLVDEVWFDKTDGGVD